MQQEELKARYPHNHVMTDARGIPSVMVWFPKYTLDTVLDGAPHVPHPAFVVDGKELDGIYISKFQARVMDGMAYSLPDVDPTTHIDFDTASCACTAKGQGFHLMTALEWGAVALWCQKNGWLPFGNNDMGKDIREKDAVAKVSYYNEEKQICRVAAGTGPVEWSHNRASDGIYDLNANVWEWSGGIRLVRGELQLLPNLRGLPAGAHTSESDAWRAIDGRTGEWLLPDGNGTTENSVKLDWVGDAWQLVATAVSDSLKHFRFCAFSDITVHESVGKSAKLLLYALGFLPSGDPSLYEGVCFYANNGAGERMCFRGGRWGQGLNAGIFKSCFDDPRTYAGDAVGFRFACYPS
ncbi:MAG: hypothetical protein E7637_03145 [Ruminococcaceae bacterium]|nr:hypothetical protein [Oscillospiraceae bacterium]